MRIKKFVCMALMGILFSCSVFAGDAELTLNKDYVNLFLKVYPEYAELLKNSGLDENISLAEIKSKSKIITGKITALLKKQGLTPEKFTALIERVTMAYTQVKMQNQLKGGAGGLMAGMGDMFGGLMTKESGISDAESAVVSEYLPQIEATFNEMGLA